MAKTESSSWPFFRIQLMGTLPGTVASKRYGARIWKSIPLVLLVG